MNYQYNIDYFLNRISKINEALNNKLKLSTIYYELVTFNYIDKYVKINELNLEKVQEKIVNEFKYNPKLKLYNDGYYLLIENRNNLNKSEFYKCIRNSLKLYIAIDENKIYGLSKKIIEFIIENNIICQFKISKTLRNDALILQVPNVEDAFKVEDYVNKTLNYNPTIYSNPFLFHRGNIGYSLNSYISFNLIISMIIEKYIKTTKEGINYDNFKKYIFSFNQSSIKELVKCLDNEKAYTSAIRIINILKSNLNNVFFAEKMKFLSPKEQKNENEDLGELFNIILNLMLKHYDNKQVYNIINEYIKCGNTYYLTKKDNIRDLVVNNYNLEQFKNYYYEMVWDLFKKASVKTLKKYGADQLENAVYILFDSGDYSSFTNDGGARYNLKNSVSFEDLKNIISTKLNGEDLNVINVIKLILN